MNMAKERESNDVLVPLNYRLKSYRPVTQTVVRAWWMMTNQDSDLSLLLHLFQQGLEPEKLGTGVTCLGQQIHVAVVACLSVESNNSRFLVDPTIAGHQLL